MTGQDGLQQVAECNLTRDEDSSPDCDINKCETSTRWGVATRVKGKLSADLEEESGGNAPRPTSQLTINDNVVSDSLPDSGTSRNTVNSRSVLSNLAIIQRL